METAQNPKPEYWDFLTKIAQKYNELKSDQQEAVLALGKKLFKNGMSFIPEPNKVNAEQHYTVTQREAQKQQQTGR